MSAAASSESPHRSRWVTVSIVLASTLLAVPLVLGRSFELIIKAINPDNVDITQGLAYLRPMLIFTWVVIAAWLAVTVLVIVRTRRVYGGEVRVAWLVLAAQVVLGALVLVLTAAVNGLTSG